MGISPVWIDVFRQCMRLHPASQGAALALLDTTLGMEDASVLIAKFVSSYGALGTNFAI
jgi:hypothetical protein